jgi:hypothetical protein
MSYQDNWQKRKILLNNMSRALGMFECTKWSLSGQIQELIFKYWIARNQRSYPLKVENWEVCAPVIQQQTRRNMEKWITLWLPRVSNYYLKINTIPSMRMWRKIRNTRSHCLRAMCIMSIWRKFQKNGENSLCSKMVSWPLIFIQCKDPKYFERSQIYFKARSTNRFRKHPWEKTWWTIFMPQSKIVNQNWRGLTLKDNEDPKLRTQSVWWKASLYTLETKNVPIVPIFGAFWWLPWWWRATSFKDEIFGYKESNDWEIFSNEDCNEV